FSSSLIERSVPYSWPSPTGADMSPRVLALIAVVSTAAVAQTESGGIGGQNVPNAGGALGGQAFTDPSQLFSGRAGAFFGLGFTTLTDAVGDPSLLAGRAYIRPFGDTLFLRGWSIGATYVTDRNAPIHYLDAAGNRSPVIAPDAQGNPFVETQRVQAAGVDTE